MRCWCRWVSTYGRMRTNGIASSGCNLLRCRLYGTSYVWCVCSVVRVGRLGADEITRTCLNTYSVLRVSSSGLRYTRGELSIEPRTTQYLADSLSAMPWGGRGWHVLLRAEYYRCSLDFQHTSTGNILVRKRGKVDASTLHSCSFYNPGRGCVPSKCKPGAWGRRLRTRLCCAGKSFTKTNCCGCWRS